MKTAIIIAIAIVLANCASFPPICSDNPRNMQCFTPTQLEKELSK